jgi:hypothetical protein
MKHVSIDLYALSKPRAKVADRDSKLFLHISVGFLLSSLHLFWDNEEDP